ncbi:hypothetical protein [Citricoccus sp. SGAir0253]|nr:hypothetical protein [Citricoccus sp. SGAir0253]
MEFLIALVIGLAVLGAVVAGVLKARRTFAPELERARRIRRANGRDR